MIGGGASGLIAAVFAARQARKRGLDVSITVYEANSRVGKKLLVTGNGRCNFTNESIRPENFHGERELAEAVYAEFTNDDTREFFESIGLYSRSDAAGRVYPMSSQATAVLDSLRYEAGRLGIRELTDTPVDSVRRHGKGFLLNERYYADRCILATGGKAAPVHGSNGSGYKLLEPFGIAVSPVYPALTPLVCDAFPKNLKGIRAQGTITLKKAGNVLASDTGELQYTDYGLSGIPSMQVSRFAARELGKGSDAVYAYVDSCPFYTAEELKNKLLHLVENNPALPGELLLSGILPKRLGLCVLSDCSISPSREAGKLHSAVIEKIVSVIKNKKYRITSVRGFADAQVSCGGIRAEEIEPRTMELKKVRGLYVCGEIVNVDGDCGGYNLQWAWSSGVKAGISAIGEM